MSVDISGLIEKIFVESDKPLFHEAAIAAKSGALRAAYLLIWLSCAESLKRRFNEAQKRDHEARKVVGKIEELEKGQRSVDKYLLSAALDHGFLNDPNHKRLLHVYEMRCVFGHPYENAPSNTEVLSAAETVIDIVLGCPLKLRHGYMKQIVDQLMNDVHYLDDLQPAVVEYAKGVIQHFDDTLAGWIVSSLLKEIHKIAEDSSLFLFVRRGVWFTRELLQQFGCGCFTPEQWHGLCTKYPKATRMTLIVPELFPQIGDQAQDYILGNALTLSIEHPSVLESAYKLISSGAANERQRERIDASVNKTIRDLASAPGFTAANTQNTINWIKAGSVPLHMCVATLIGFMKTKNWYIQQPAISFLAGLDADAFEVLDGGSMEQIGRNICQAADGNCTEAKNYLSNTDLSVPAGVFAGLLAECFTNESRQFRLKVNQLTDVIRIADTQSHEAASDVANWVAHEISESHPKHGKDTTEEIALVVQQFGDRPWATNLIESLNQYCDTHIEQEEEVEL